MDVAIRDAMVPESGTPGFFAGVRALGVSAVEVEITRDMKTKHIHRPDGTPYSLATQDDASELRGRLDSEGLRAVALLLATDFSGPDPDDTVQWCLYAIVFGERLNAPVIRIDPLALDKELPRDRVRENVVRQVARVVRAAEMFGMDLGLENHGPIANDPAFLDEVLAAVDSPRLGLTLDTGNFYWFGVPLGELYALIERFAPRVKHTHFKNINYPPDLANVRREVGVGYKEYCCALDEGNVDLSRVVRILRAAGYDRDLCIENESLFKHPPEARAKVLRRDVAAVRAAMRE